MYKIILVVINSQILNPITDVLGGSIISIFTYSITDSHNVFGGEISGLIDAIFPVRDLLKDRQHVDPMFYQLDNWEHVMLTPVMASCESGPWFADKFLSLSSLGVRFFKGILDLNIE